MGVLSEEGLYSLDVPHGAGMNSSELSGVEDDILMKWIDRVVWKDASIRGVKSEKVVVEVVSSLFSVNVLVDSSCFGDTVEDRGKRGGSHGGSKKYGMFRGCNIGCTH